MLEQILIQTIPSVLAAIVTASVAFAKVTTRLDLQNTKLDYLQKDIERYGAHNKEEIQGLHDKIGGQARTLYKLIEFINSQNAGEGRKLFNVSKYDNFDDN